MNTIVEIDGKTYDFTPYHEAEDIQNYYGFIGPDGSFYRVRSKYAEDIDGPHDSWAREYMRYHHLANDFEGLTSPRTLVKQYGFILCTYATRYDEQVDIFIIPESDGIFTIDRLRNAPITEAQYHTTQIVATDIHNYKR